MSALFSVLSTLLGGNSDFTFSKSIDNDEKVEGLEKESFEVVLKPDETCVVTYTCIRPTYYIYTIKTLTGSYKYNDEDDRGDGRKRLLIEITGGSEKNKMSKTDVNFEEKDYTNVSGKFKFSFEAEGGRNPLWASDTYFITSDLLKEPESVLEKWRYECERIKEANAWESDYEICKKIDELGYHEYIKERFADQFENPKFELVSRMSTPSDAALWLAKYYGDYKQAIQNHCYNVTEIVDKFKDVIFEAFVETMNDDLTNTYDRCRNFIQGKGLYNDELKEMKEYYDLQDEKKNLGTLVKQNGSVIKAVGAIDPSKKLKRVLAELPQHGHTKEEIEEVIDYDCGTVADFDSVLYLKKNNLLDLAMKIKEEGGEKFNASFTDLREGILKFKDDKELIIGAYSNKELYEKYKDKYEPRIFYIAAKYQNVEGEEAFLERANKYTKVVKYFKGKTIEPEKYLEMEKDCFGWSDEFQVVYSNGNYNCPEALVDYHKDQLRAEGFTEDEINLCSSMVNFATCGYVPQVINLTKAFKSQEFLDYFKTIPKPYITDASDFAKYYTENGNNLKEALLSTMNVSANIRSLKSDDEIIKVYFEFFKNRGFLMDEDTFSYYFSESDQQYFIDQNFDPHHTIIANYGNNDESAQYLLTLKDKYPPQKLLELFKKHRYDDVETIKKAIAE